MNLRLQFVVICVVLAAAAVLLRDRRVMAEPTAAAGAAPGAGVIRGVVELTGAPPKRVPIKRDIDPVCAKSPKLSEDIVALGGKLRDVHVRVRVGTAGTHKAPSEPAVVNQLECMYSPRVIGIIQGQRVAITNSDKTYHNVRGAKGKRTVWNLGQPAAAPAIIRENLGKAGDVVSLHCDIHPWMRAYAVITDHPYFDVTGAGGSFTLNDVPAGTYTLEAWHPELGLKTTKVTVHKGKTAEVTFRF